VLELDRDGAQRFPQALPPAEVHALLQALEANDLGRPGSRLNDVSSLRPWITADGIVGQIVAGWLGPNAAPVRVILFDKSASSNWALGWHQDRTIAVQHRADVPGFGNWNLKGGIDHVEPPFDLIERMLTVRIHLDPVSRDNAPLLMSPGSHRCGKIADSRMDEVVKRLGIAQCLADAGDVWVYRTAIVHASKRSSLPTRRRVLQVDYSAEELPEPLRWHLAD